LRSCIKKAARTACAGAAALALAACSSGGSTTPFPGLPGSVSPPGPPFSLSHINNRFAAMPALKPLAARGSGRIAVILSVNATAKHFTAVDVPYLKESFKKAGLSTAQYTVRSSQGSKQFRAVRQAISNGASVLVLDARYSGAGSRIESYAKAHHVPVIDYDWLTLGGTRKYYVGFDSLKIGVLLGQGLVSCVSAWGVKDPRVIVMKGGPEDYNSALYAEGYGAVLTRQFSAGWKDVSNPPGTWDPAVARSEFQQQYTAHKKVNAALIPNDENGTDIIGYLKGLGVKAWKFPTTGLDATLGGLQRILTGYQCGTVYKPVYQEAQAAAALAIYVWAGVKPPGSLVNWSLTDPQTNRSVASVLLTPEWVTRQNMKSTVIADGFVLPSELCKRYRSACLAAGIRPPAAAAP
jgi:D-xylose transport system substrate-binding protein